MKSRFLLALLLPLCSTAPAPFDAKHTHDGNDTRNDKIFDNSQINMGDLTVDTATGDNMQIGHTLDINVVQSPGVQSVKESADNSHGHAPSPAHSHNGDFDERLRRLFKSIDTDDDGLISVTELIRICNENNVYITELEAENVLTLPDETVPFTLSYFLAILENAANSSDTGDLIHFLLQSAGSLDHVMFDKNLMHVFLALDVDHDCQLFVPDILTVFQDLGNPMLLDEAKSLLSGHHGHNHHDGVDFSLWKKLILGEVFKIDDLMLLGDWRDAFIEVKKIFNTGKAVAEGEGKPSCKGRNFPDGQECCESEDPEGSKCVEGQGDCDSDEGCAGNLVCGSDNCIKYNPLADPEDDCCTPKFVGDIMRTNIENAAKTAVNALKHGSELGECYKGELLKVESASVEVVEGLQYKLQLRVSTMGGDDCMESREMICENIMMMKPLPKDCKGTDPLKLINREYIACEQVEVGKVGFENCVDTWCLQEGTDEQYTRCEEATDGGNTCINPLIKYGSTEGGIPNVMYNQIDDYNAWCKMIFHEERTGSVTLAGRDAAETNGYVYWCEGGDEDGYKWCDVSDSLWKDGSLDYAYTVISADSVSSLSCTPGVTMET